MLLKNLMKIKISLKSCKLDELWLFVKFKRYVRAFIYNYGNQINTKVMYVEGGKIKWI